MVASQLRRASKCSRKQARLLDLSNRERGELANLILES